MQHHRMTLSNGLRVVHVPMPAMRSVAVAIFVGVGSRYEAEPEAGVCHLIEHMLFKGTARRPAAADISATIDSVGGILNAGTEKETTVYSAKVAVEHLDVAVDLLADMLRWSRLSPADLVKEKNVVLEELNMLADDAEDWVHVLLDEILWPDQALGREVAGTVKSVSSLRRADLRQYLAAYYGPNNAVVSVAGGVDTDSVLGVVSAHLGDWQPVAGGRAPEVVRTDGGAQIRVEDMATKQVNICVAYPAVGRDHRDRWALELLSIILGGGTSSRLFVQVRERLGLAYDIDAYTVSLSDAGCLTVYAAADARKTERLLDGVFREVHRLQRRRVSSEELGRAKQYWCGRLWLALEETQAVAHWHGAQGMLLNEVMSPEQVVSRVNAITAAEVMEVAQKYLVPESARIAAVGPASRDVLESRLACA